MSVNTNINGSEKIYDPVLLETYRNNYRKLQEWQPLDPSKKKREGIHFASNPYRPIRTSTLWAVAMLIASLVIMVMLIPVIVYTIY